MRIEFIHAKHLEECLACSLPLAGVSSHGSTPRAALGAQEGRVAAGAAREEASRGHVPSHTHMHKHILLSTHSRCYTHLGFFLFLHKERKQ